MVEQRGPARRQSLALERRQLTQIAGMRPSESLKRHRSQVLELALSRGTTHLRVFGSAARGVDREDSDLDLMVTWPCDRSLLELVGLQQDLQDALGLNHLIDEMTALMLAEFDAETQFKLRATRGAGKTERGLALLEKAGGTPAKR